MIKNSNPKIYANNNANVQLFLLIQMFLDPGMKGPANHKNDMLLGVNTTFCTIITHRSLLYLPIKRPTPFPMTPAGQCTRCWPLHKLVGFNHRPIAATMS